MKTGSDRPNTTPEGIPTRPPRGRRSLDGERRLVPAAYVLVTMVTCLLVWSFLFAPVLERSADAGPIGARRSAALTFLRPLAGLSDVLRMTRVTEVIERALGRDPDVAPGGVVDLEPPPLSPIEEPLAGPSASPSPLPIPGEPIREPKQNAKLRTVVIGDSLASGLGVGLEAMFDPDLVRVWNQGRISTGLARQDYFNWQASIRQIVASYRPDLVVVMLGQNDNQAQRAADGSAIPIGSTEWVRAYREQATAFLRAATRGGARVVWVGIPVVRDQERWPIYRRLNGIYEEVAASQPELATYLDSWSLFEDDGGGYTGYVPNERGNPQLMRGPDGVHLLPVGNNLLARAVIRRAEDVFELTDEAAAFSI
jgi:hypothetical protein